MAIGGPIVFLVVLYDETHRAWSGHWAGIVVSMRKERQSGKDAVGSNYSIDLEDGESVKVSRREWRRIDVGNHVENVQRSYAINITAPSGARSTE